MMKKCYKLFNRFTIFRTLKQHFEKETIKVEEMKGEKSTVSVPSFGGTIAGGVSAIVTQPIDTFAYKPDGLGCG